MRLLLAIALAACATVPGGRARSIAYSMSLCLRSRAGWPEPYQRACDCDARAQCLAAGLPSGCAMDAWMDVAEGGYPTLAGGCK